MGYLREIDASAILADTNYPAKEPPNSDQFFRKNCDNVEPAVWKMGKPIGFIDKLCEIAESLGGAVASSTGLEKTFSSVELTYGTLRHQLVTEKAGKLVFP